MQIIHSNDSTLRYDIILPHLHYFMCSFFEVSYRNDHLLCHSPKWYSPVSCKFILFKNSHDCPSFIFLLIVIPIPLNRTTTIEKLLFACSWIEIIVSYCPIWLATWKYVAKSLQPTIVKMILAMYNQLAYYIFVRNNPLNFHPSILAAAEKFNQRYGFDIFSILDDYMASLPLYCQIPK